jgi:hypothetical protein
LSTAIDDLGLIDADDGLGERVVIADFRRRAQSRRVSTPWPASAGPFFTRADQILHHPAVMQITARSYRLKDKRRADIMAGAARTKETRNNGTSLSG